jgi:hypothetical protein
MNETKTETMRQGTPCRLNPDLDHLAPQGQDDASDPLAPRSTRSGHPHLDLRRDHLSHSAGGAGLSPTLSSLLSSPARSLAAFLTVRLH